MTLQTAGKISLGDVNVELGRTRTVPVSLGGSQVRALANVVSGVVRLSNLRGKTYIPPEADISYLLTTAVYSTNGIERVGFVSTVAPTGALSPATWKGYPISSMALWFYGSSTNANFQFAIDSKAARVAAISTIKSFTIGGINVPVSVASEGDGKFNPYVIGNVSVETYNAIKAQLLGRTTTVTVHYG